MPKGKRHPNRTEHYVPERLRALAKTIAEAHYGGNESAYIQDLIARDAEARAERGRVTLLAQAGSAPIQVREKILAALVVHDGNATGARKLLGAAEGDWRRAIDALALGDEIAKRWPARRAVQRQEDR